MKRKIAEVSELDPWFNESAVKYSDLRNYLESNSTADGDRLKTLSVTRKMREQIEKEDSKEKFLRFVERNLNDFRSVREKARYYYCKYLNFYIEEKVERYLAAYERRFGMEQAAMDLAVLKCKSDLRKNRRVQKIFEMNYQSQEYHSETFMMHSTISIFPIYQQTGWK